MEVDVEAGTVDWAERGELVTPSTVRLPSSSVTPPIPPTAAIDDEPNAVR